MRFSIPQVLSGLSFALSALAGPIPGPEAVTSNARDLERREPGGVYMCTAINWGGYCEHAVYALDQCWQVTGDFQYTVSSFGPDRNTLCQLYYDFNCQDAGGITQQLNGVLVYPGSADLRPYWNDAIGSFKCSYFQGGGGK